MTKRIFAIAILATLFLTSCKDSKPETAEKETTDTTITDVINNSFTDQSGNTLDVVFDNTKKIATVVLNGETIEMAEQRTASGFGYQNDEYELNGKGEQVTLTKGEEVIFSNQDEIIQTTAKDASGQEMTMIFNNTLGVVTVLFNEETIEMETLKPASGMWYKNDHYELTGKGDKVELIKDGKTVFKN